MTNSSATINNSFDFEKVSELIEQIVKNLGNLHLVDNQETELKSDISEIKEMINRKDEKGTRKILHKIDGICQNITGSLVASGIIAQIGQILG